MLVTGAGLLLRTVVALDRVDPGYHADRVLTMYVTLPLARYKTPQRALTFYQAAEREMASLPGVRSVGLGFSLPMDGWEIGQGFTVVGAPPVGEAEEPAAHYQMVNAKYFETLGSGWYTAAPSRNTTMPRPRRCASSTKNWCGGI